MKEWLVKSLKEHLNQVTFIPAVSYEEYINYYASTDICVFPSLWENTPNVCMEAMSAGRALIGSKYGGMTEMLDNPTAGILVDPLNADEIVSAIIKLVKNKEMRFKLGKQARESVIKKFNKERIGSMIEEQYQKAITKAAKHKEGNAA